MSVLTLSAISLERWQAICRPLAFRSTSRRARIIIMAIWIVAISASAPELFVLQLNPEFRIVVTKLLIACHPVWPHEGDQIIYDAFLMLCFYFAPVALMGFAYVRIAYCLWSSTISGTFTEGKSICLFFSNVVFTFMCIIIHHAS